MPEIFLRHTGQPAPATLRDFTKNLKTGNRDPRKT